MKLNSKASQRYVLMLDNKIDDKDVYISYNYMAQTIAVTKDLNRASKFDDSETAIDFLKKINFKGGLESKKIYVVPLITTFATLPSVDEFAIEDHLDAE